MNCWIGVDPGKSGAIAILYEDATVEFIDNDEPLVTISDKIREVDMEHNIKMITIEDVHSIFGASAKSNFQFGFNVGTLHGFFKALQFPIDTIQPKAWQKHIGVKSTIKGKAVKTAVAEIMSNQFPKQLEQFYTPRKKLLDGRVDALAIATYCKFKHP